MFSLYAYMCTKCMPIGFSGVGVMYGTMWVVGTEPRSSERATSALSHGTISSVSIFISLFIMCL